MKKYRYRCTQCAALVTTPAPYKGKHYVSIVGLGNLGMLNLFCPGKLVPVAKR